MTEADMRKIAILAVLVLILGGAGAWYWRSHVSQQITFRTVRVFRGDLRATISATGTLQPQELIDVGAQVNGPIKSLGKDPTDPTKSIDYGSAVEGPVLDSDGKIIKAGTLLAEIDPAIYQAQYASATADLERAKADLKQKEALLNAADKDFVRAQNLKKDKGISEAEYDQLEAAYKTAVANKDVSKAQIGVSEAAKEMAATNLRYTKITSPVKGIIIDRRVNVGQTVVANLTATSMFLIAKDLTKMEVWAVVNEVDVGKVYIDQPVEFTIDALPGKRYEGKVKPQGDYPARLNANMTQNVVTYTVVVSVGDPIDLKYAQGKLWPYWTTNVTFIVGEKKDALLVPNAALRWQPSRRQIAPDAREAYNKIKSKKKVTTDADAADYGVVWIKADDGFVRPLGVQIGLTDSVNSEILEPIPEELREGTELVVGEGKAQSDSGGANPFTVQMFKKKEKEKD
jgi:HlyD family secretion protein